MTKLLAFVGIVLLMVSLYYFVVVRQSKLDLVVDKQKLYDGTSIKDKPSLVKLKSDIDDLNESISTLLWIGYVGLVVSSVLVTSAFFLHRRELRAKKSAAASESASAAQPTEPDAPSEPDEAGPSVAANDPNATGQQGNENAGEQSAGESPAEQGDEPAADAGDKSPDAETPGAET